MSSLRPERSGDAFLPRPRVSGFALSGFVLGVLGCIPLLTGISAIILSALGIRATRRPDVRGRGLAIAGLVLGILSILAWAGIGAFLGLLIAGSRTPRADLTDFTASLVAGNIPAAHALCDPSISARDLAALHDKLAPLGTCAGLTCTSISLNASTGAGQRCTLGGNAHFSAGDHSFNAVMIKGPSGSWKVLGFHVF